MTRHRLRFAAAALTLAALPAAAHDLSITDALAVLKTDGTYQIDLVVEADALALGLPQHAASPVELAGWLEALAPAEFEAAVERARDTVARRVHVRFDGREQEPVVSFPQLDSPLPGGDPASPTVLGATARLAGRVPAGAVELTFGLSPALGGVALTVLDQATATGSKQVVGPGEDSHPWRLGAPAAAAGRTETAARYMLLGFEHILPLGVDHVLFVLGLFLLSMHWRPLLWQITCFTVAHTVTLALSMFEVVSLAPRIVEPLIALSIAYVAIENIVTSELRPWRPVVVFCFGLLHGLGFAGALRELGLPTEQFITALVGFNLGVEAGQLTVVGAAFLLLGAFRSQRWYRPAVAVPLSAAIGAIGLWWAFERAVWGV